MLVFLTLLAAAPDGLLPIEHEALTLKRAGDYVGALPLFEEALTLRRGEADTWLASVLNNLADTYKKLGRYDDALPLHEESLALRITLFGPESPQVVISHGNLAALQEERAGLEEALRQLGG